MTIGLLHHPLSWFVAAEAPDLEPLFERVFDFHLHGHEHKAWVKPLADGSVRGKTDAHGVWHLDSLRCFAQRRGPRTATGPAQLSAEILEDIERIQARFFESLRPFLAGGELISRKETQEVRSLLDDDTNRIVVVHGAAGSGKSGISSSWLRN